MRQDEENVPVEELTEGMSDVLSRFKQLESEIESLGVNPHNFERLRDLVEAYSDLQEELIQERKKQFYDTAWLYCSKMKVAQPKHVQALAVFLRLCARLWVGETLEMVNDSSKKDIDEIVDRLSNVPENAQEVPDASDRG